MQTNGVVQSPGSICMTLHVTPTHLTTRQNNSTVVALERRLKAFAVDQFSVREAVKSEMALMQATFEKCQEQLINKTLAFVKDNEVLRQQLVTTQRHEREVGRVHAQQMAVKETQIASLQSQMAKLIADKEAETQKLQNMLKVEQQKTAALEATGATWEQQKAQLNQQNSNLQAQVNAVSGERDALRTQVNGEPQRQKAAVDARVALVTEWFRGKVVEYVKWCRTTPPQAWLEEQCVYSYMVQSSRL